jgi:glycosyltransferase involved in cell wall biosynthesis
VNDTLSVVLPVFNAQESLSREVGELLEVLSDLTDQFELILVDDGSTDQTLDVADELARRYPQIRVSRHLRRFGSSAAVQTGLEAATGEYVFVQDELSPVSASDIQRLWELRLDEDLTAKNTATGAGVISSDLLRRLGQWGIALQQNTANEATNCGIQMIRRHAVEDLRKTRRATEQVSLAE